MARLVPYTVCGVCANHLVTLLMTSLPFPPSFPSPRCSEAGVEYRPVCSADGVTTFFSPCHAGCTRAVERGDRVVFTDCACAGQAAINGTAARDSAVVDWWSEKAEGMEVRAASGARLGKMNAFYGTPRQEKHISFVYTIFGVQCIYR